jgi:hypothetical protein
MLAHNIGVSMLANILYLFLVQFFSWSWLGILIGESVCPECNIGFWLFVDTQKIMGAKLGIAGEKNKRKRNGVYWFKGCHVKQAARGRPQVYGFLFTAKSSKVNWLFCNEELWLEKPLNPTLHIFFVTHWH